MKNKINWKEELPTLRKYIEEDKMTYGEVADIYKLDKSSIEGTCKRYGIQYSHKATGPWTDEEIDIVKEGLKLGKTYQEIADNLENRTKNGVKNLYQTRKSELKIVNPNTPATLYVTREQEIEVVDLLLKGYKYSEISNKTGLKRDSIKRIKLRNNIMPPSKKELINRGIFYNLKGQRLETGLTKDILLKHLNDDKMTISEIARKYNLPITIVNDYSNSIGWHDSKLSRAKDIKRKLLKDLWGINEPSSSDLKKSFSSIFTKEFILDLLKRNNYCTSRCAKELGGIDPKCIVEAMKNFNIEVPEDLDKIRKFSGSLESRKENTKEEFHEFFNKYYPDYEIVEGYSGYTSYMKVRCKKHPDELISFAPYTIRSHTKFNESGELISNFILCEKCRKEEDYKNRLLKVREKIESLFPGEYDTSNMSITTSTLYNIKCLKCGETFDVCRTNFLKHGRCIKCESISSGEKLTKLVLKKLKINFKHNDRKFDIVPKDIRSKVIIDFTLEYKRKPIWIEYNGEQHYTSKIKFSNENPNPIYSFKNRVLRDMWVRKYCEENNIGFIEIPYTFDTVDKIQNLLQRVIINGEDINRIIDYAPFYEEIKKLGISIDN